MSFILVNPVIESKSIKSNKKSLDNIAEDLWSKYSKNIKNYATEFYFSFMESGSDNIHHYQVNEILENNKVKYSLKKYKNKNLNDKEFIKSITQNGGKKYHKKYRHNDSSSSSSDDDEIVYHSNKKLYSPQIHSSLSAITYYPNIYGMNNISLPTLADRYSYVIKDGKPTIIAPNATGTGIYNISGNKWSLSENIKNK
jgi:hypothetical protein